MFQKILDIFRRENLLKQAYDLSYEMLEIILEMYKASIDFLRKDDVKELNFDIYGYDKKVNKFEREVRKKVLTHLALSSSTTTSDIAPSLVLISIVIDIERIGDYTKNITELAENYPDTLSAGKYETVLKKIESKLTKNFEDLILCFKDYHIDLAKKIMDENAGMNKEINKVLTELMKEENKDFDTRDGIAVALYFRFLKRISSHVKNVASGIVNPFHKIGFKAEEMKNLK